MATAVFFHAHPDDEALSTGGKMLLASRAGHRVVLVCATEWFIRRGHTPADPPATDLFAALERSDPAPAS